MNSKKRILIFLLFCMVLVTLFTVLHFLTREDAEDGSILIEVAGQISEVDFSKLQLTEVSGCVKKKNQSVEEISGNGVLLRDVIAYAGILDYESICVISRDEYRAVISADEIKDVDVAYILLQDGACRLYVFGDENSKRNVSDVIKIRIEE